MEYIKRMEEELIELKSKIEKLLKFLDNQCEFMDKTNEKQRMLLALQSVQMASYADILEDRIKYEKELNGLDN